MSDYLHSANRQVKAFGNPAPEETTIPTVGGLDSVPEPSPVEQPLTAPAVRSSMPQTCAPGFTMVDGDCKPFAKEYAPRMEQLDYIGNTDMLLSYLLHEERHHHVTMPIKACGIDPVLFDHVPRLEMGEGQPQNFFTISEALPKEGDEEVQHVYELVAVDNALYLSCVSECLDEEYLHTVIMEATITMRETGSYVFRMVGLRRLVMEPTEEKAKLLETLRLNTFEMSALCAYMTDFGVEPSFEIIDGHQCICFRTL